MTLPCSSTTASTVLIITALYRRIGRNEPPKFDGSLGSNLDEHLLRYCARALVALERLSVRRGEDGRIARVGYVLPRRKAANWVGPERGRKSKPGPIRKILTHLGEPLEPPLVLPARRPPTDWAELVQAQDDRNVFQASPDTLPVIDIHSL